MQANEKPCCAPANLVGGACCSKAAAPQPHHHHHHHHYPTWRPNPTQPTPWDRARVFGLFRSGPSCCGAGSCGRRAPVLQRPSATSCQRRQQRPARRQHCGRSTHRLMGHAGTRSRRTGLLILMCDVAPWFHACVTLRMYLSLIHWTGGKGQRCAFQGAETFGAPRGLSDVLCRLRVGHATRTPS